MIDQKGLQAFVAIIQHQSFEKAANALFITQSAVSQRLKSLEQNMGHSLLLRTPNIQVTPAGQGLLKYAQDIEMLERDLKKKISPQRKSEWLKLSIATNADSLSTWLLSALSPWCLKYKILLNLKIADQDQTHHFMRTGEVIGCISGVEQASQGYQSISIGNVKYYCICSPSFYQKHFAKGVTKASILRAPVVIFNSHDRLQHQFLAEFYDIDADRLLQHFIPSSDAYIEWIQLGMGMGLAPIQQIKPLIENNSLRLLNSYQTINIPLYWQQSNLKTELNDSLMMQIKQYAEQAHFDQIEND